MLAAVDAVTEMEHEMLVERTQAGLARAKSEGETLWLPSKDTAGQRADIIAKYVRAKTCARWPNVCGIARRSSICDQVRMSV